jgi:ATP/maltotriose-dependent transcriptional regulator MalT
MFALLKATFFPEPWEESLALAGEAAGWPREGVPAFQVGEALWHAAQVFYQHGELEASDRLLGAIEQRWARDSVVAIIVMLERVIHAGHVGDFERALAVGEDLARRAREFGNHTLSAYAVHTIAPVLLRLGRAEDCLAMLQDWMAGESGAVLQTPLLAALAHLHMGRHLQARRLVDEFLARRRERLGELNFATRILVLEAAVLLEDHDLAADLVPFALPLARGIPSGYPVSTARVLGQARLLLGDVDAARSHLNDALEVCARSGFRPELASARLDLAELLVRHFPEERAEAREHLEFATAEFKAMGMHSYLARARRLRAKDSRTVSRAGPSFPNSLSAREVEVLRLLAMGKTNQEIADGLVISLNTVATHVRSIFYKTHSANRAEAATYALRQRLI